MSFWDIQINWKRDALMTLLFGGLSLLLSYVSFYVPGVVGGQSDLRELPLVIGIFHLSNPLYALGLSTIILVNQPPDGSYLSSFFMHALSLFILWYLFEIVKKQKLNLFKSVLSILFLVCIYYLFLLLPLLIITNFLVGLNVEKHFLTFYKELIYGAKYEIISVTIAFSLYAIQHKLRIELQDHKLNLEHKVKERTEHLDRVIKDLQRTQHSLIQSEKMASIGNLTSGVAHEINNPLNFISGGIQMLEDIKPEIRTNTSKNTYGLFSQAIDIISEGLERSVSIVNALMTFSKRVESKLEHYDVHKIIDNALLFMKSGIPEHITIEKEYGLTVLVPLFVDKMHQVFINILNNAIYALSVDGHKEKKIIIKTMERDRKAMIEIFNSGPEIPLKDINQIFDPFFTTKDPDKGNGLGLSISYNYMKEHDGEISVKNTHGGVIFVIELPIK